MRVPLSVLLLTACTALFGISGTRAAVPAPNPATQLIIDNHQKLITVKDGNGKWIFAQVSSSDNVLLEFIIVSKKKTLIELKDHAGKVMWSKSVTPAVDDQSRGLSVIDGAWSESFGIFTEKACTALHSLVPSTAHLETAADMSKVSRIAVEIGPADQISGAVFVMGKYRVDFQTNPDAVVFTESGNKTVVIVPTTDAKPQPAAATKTVTTPTPTPAAATATP